MEQNNNNYKASFNKDRNIILPQQFSDEEMARDWTLNKKDLEMVSKYSRSSRLFISIQLCTVRIYGRFLSKVNSLSPRILSYLNTLLDEAAIAEF